MNYSHRGNSENFAIVCQESDPSTAHSYNQACEDHKLANVVRYTILSQYFHFVVFERWISYDYETEYGCVYLIFAVLLHKFNWTY